MKSLRIPMSVALLAAVASTAVAQQPTPAPAPAAAAAQTPLTPEQQAQVERQNAEMGAAAQQVLQMIDADRAGEVWDGASQTMKSAVDRDTFIRQLAADRGQLGAATRRDAPAVSRSQFQAGESVPAGIYINVAFPTTFAAQPQPIRELVSFRLDEDRTWRVSGYSVR